MSIANKKCAPCEANAPTLSKIQAEKMLREIPGWELIDDGKSILRKFTFKGFYPTMSFVNAVAYMAQKEGHHPDISLGYNYCQIKYTTHAIGGLSENDFICAAKINAL